MSPTSNKQILVAGQGGPLNPEDEAQYGSLDNILRLVFADVQKAQAAGFDCTPFQVNPHEPIEGFKAYDDLLARQHWDAIIIGFGIRGTKQFTAVFERIVNECREKSPTTKMGFSEGPESLFETITRLFPQA